MKNKLILWIYMTLSLLLVLSCNSEHEGNGMEESSSLQLDVSIGNTTRSIYIPKSYFSKGDSIGIFLQNGSGTTYNNSPLNIPATYNGSTWKVLSNVSLTSDTAVVYGYYPYNKSVNSFIVPVDASSGKTDYLYGKSSVFVNGLRPSASIFMKHALARVTLQVSKASSDTGKCVLSSVMLRNASGASVISTSGTMDVKTGTITAAANSSGNITRTFKDTVIGMTGISIDFYVIPATINNNALVSFKIDGKSYSSKLSATSWNAGQQYTYPILINRAPDNIPVGGTVGKMVDLGLSVKWADHNVGATNPEDYGGYFAWGETATKSDYSWTSYKYCNGTQETCIDIGSHISGTQYDVAHVQWGGSWRMPTHEEFQELYSKCTRTWSTYNGVNGYKFVGPNGNSLFLPAAGSRWDKDVGSQGSYGYYWSDTVNSDYSSFTWYLSFDSGYVYPDSNSNRYGGFSVRPVSK